MIQITETKLTTSVSLTDAKAMRHLLSQLPSGRHDIKISADEFTEDEWRVFNEFYVALGQELEGGEE